MSGISVLGPVTLVGDDGTPLPLGSRRQSLLLAVLVSRGGRPTSTDELVDALWADDLPAHPTAALQSRVFRLRRLLPGGVELRTEGSGYRLATPPDRLDAARFEALAAQARAPGVDPAVAVGLLDRALGLWRGRAYGDVADHEAVRAEADRLDDLRAGAAEDRAVLMIDLRRATEAAQDMEALAAEHPFRERPVALRMRALAAAGRHQDALAAFATFRRTLATELGLEPSPELRAVEADVLGHERPRPPRLGLPGNTLVGREVALADISARLATGRVVTLTGAGGVGKSRLALHAAARAAGDHPDGTFLCELAPVASSAAVAPAVAGALRLQPAAGQTDTERILDLLASRRALLVLDNCEHVLDGVRDLTTAVLARAPEVDVLATSRRRLGVEGEHVVPVAPLALPSGDDPDAPAVALFVDRVRDLRPDFALDAEATSAVCALCRLVDGLPLAIELAAARTVAQAPAEVVADIGDRLDRLDDPHRSRARHRSIEAVVAWSYDPLSPVERHLARTVTVFSGGFTLAAATEVADMAPTDAAAALTSLVEASLVTARATGGTTRYSMLEPIRQFAAARAADEGAAGTAQARHAAWAATWVEQADAGLRGRDEARWARAVAAELPNLRAAHRWCLAHDPGTALRIAGAVYWSTYWHGTTEATGWAAEAVADDHPPSPALAAACATASLGAYRRGEVAEARALAERGIAATDGPAGRFPWEALSSLESLTGNYERALACQERARALAIEARDTAQAAREQAASALVLGYLGRVDEATAELAAATRDATATGNPTVEGFCDYVGGEIHLDRAPMRALPLLERARDAGRAAGNPYLAAIAGVSALSCAARTGDPARALHGYAELLDYFDRTGSRAQQWTTVRTLIETLTRLGHDEPAATLCGALAASTATLPLIGPDAVRMDDARRTLAARLGEARFDELTAGGAALGDDRAIAFARRYAARPPGA